MHHSTHDLLAPVPGISRQLHSFHFGPRGGGKVYIQASLHADELPGMLVAWHLKRRLAELEQQGRLQRGAPAAEQPNQDPNAPRESPDLMTGSGLIRFRIRGRNGDPRIASTE